MFYTLFFFAWKKYDEIRYQKTLTFVREPIDVENQSWLRPFQTSLESTVGYNTLNLLPLKTAQLSGDCYFACSIAA